MKAESTSCPLCGAAEQRVAHEGPIRMGRFGSRSERAHRVVFCAACGAGRLLDPPAVDYGSAEYRTLVDGESSAAGYYALHDAEQALKLEQLGMPAVRDKVVADIGCGAGSFLDVVRGAAARTIAIEPARIYHPVLRERGHEVFADAAEAVAALPGTVDTAVCFSVIEHVDDPRALLTQIRALLKPGGELLLSTPNARDWLLDLLPDDYPSFFYRAVHRWYFDGAALEKLAVQCGFASLGTRFVHRYDLANLLLWLRDRRPSGLGRIDIPLYLEGAFRGFLEETGRADYIYARFRA